MEHATDKEGKAEHAGEWAGIFLVFIILIVFVMVTQTIQLESNRGQFERLEAIEFQMSCPEDRHALNVDGDFVCLVDDEQNGPSR